MRLRISSTWRPTTCGGKRLKKRCTIQTASSHRFMDIGTFDDVQGLERALGMDCLAPVVRQAEIGWFRPQSWSYWHYRLGLVDKTARPPPMPMHTLG